MFFRNIQLFQMTSPLTDSQQQIEEKLALRPLVPCPAASYHSSGWVPVIENGRLVESAGAHHMAVQGIEERVLPGSVIKRAAKAKAAEWEKQRGFKPGRKLMREFTEQVTLELLPKAFVRPKSVRGWIDVAAKRIAIDSTSAARADAWICQLRDAMDGGLPEIAYLGSGKRPGAVMASWLMAPDCVPNGFVLGDSCQLAGTADKSAVRFTHHPLNTGQVRMLIEQGFTPKNIELVWNNRVSLVVTDKLDLRKIDFLDVDEAKSAGGDQTAEEQFTADFTLMAGILSPMVSDLLKAFDIESAS
jgi:recombination associated protein RdgC